MAKTPKSKAKTVSKDTSRDFVPDRSKQVLARTNSDGSVAIIRLDSDQYFFTLEGISAEVWNRINGKTSVSKITETMLKKHGYPGVRFTKDVLKLVSDLRKERLIV